MGRGAAARAPRRRRGARLSGSVRPPAYRPAIAKRPFKRSLFGYRAGDVDEAFAARNAALARAGESLSTARALAEERAAAVGAAEAEVAERERELGLLAGELERCEDRNDELEGVAGWLSDRVVEREGELREAREELDRLRAGRERELDSLRALAAELAAIRAQARGQATRIRLRALREAAELSDRLAELAERPEELRDDLIAALREAIARVGEEPPEDDDGSANRRPRSARDLFEGMVEVEIGPLRDFSQLVGFEDAAGGIVATREISVKRFAQGRATLEMRLAEPVELLRELEERAPFEFRVRDRRADRVVLDVGG